MAELSSGEKGYAVMAIFSRSFVKQIAAAAGRPHGADHDHFAMREIDELNDAIDHRVAERDHGIDAAERKAVDELLQEDIHRAFRRRHNKTAPAGAVED